MKRINNIIYTVLVVAALGGLQFCSYEDKSTGAENGLPRIVIDTAGINSGSRRLYIAEGKTLMIEPEIKYEGGSDEDFEFEWRLGVTPQVEDNYTPGEYRVISTEKHLEWIVDVGPPQMPTMFYHLWYRVRHKQTEVIASVQWRLSPSAGGYRAGDHRYGRRPHLRLLGDQRQCFHPQHERLGAG